MIQNPDVRIFAVLDSGDDDFHDWLAEPCFEAVLCESERTWLFVVAAKNVRRDGTVIDCYIDIVLPERISDFAYFLSGERLDRRYLHECDGEVVCAVPIECYGFYDLFYSRKAPQVGIDILNEGLAISSQKHIIAEDLGYILRDERRFSEAAPMFQLAADGGPSSYFIYEELADCYDAIGQPGKANEYRQRSRDAQRLI